MFIHLAIHRPHADKADLLIDSMHRFGDAIRSQPGLREAHTLKDATSGALIGLAIWDSKESMLAARPAMQEAVKDDDFAAWEPAGPEIYHLIAV